jgi:hypothetical protein
MELISKREEEGGRGGRGEEGGRRREEEGMRKKEGGRGRKREEEGGRVSLVCRTESTGNLLPTSASSVSDQSPETFFCSWEQICAKEHRDSWIRNNYPLQ